MENDLYLPLVRTLQSEFDAAEKDGSLDFMKFIARAESAFKASGFREDPKHGVENILIMRLDMMGDFIISSGFIRELRANYQKLAAKAPCFSYGDEAAPKICWNRK